MSESDTIPVSKTTEADLRIQNLFAGVTDDLENIGNTEVESPKIQTQSVAEKENSVIEPSRPEAPSVSSNSEKAKEIKELEQCLPEYTPINLELESNNESSDSSEEEYPSEVTDYQDLQNVEREFTPVLQPVLKDFFTVPAPKEVYTKTDNGLHGDVSDIKFEEVSKTDPRLLIEAIQKSRKAAGMNYASTQVVSLISGYVVKIRGMNTPDILNVTSSFTAEPILFETICRTIFDNIVQATFKDWGFNRWMMNTSYLDYNSLVFGLYAASWPGANPYSIVCPKCGKTHQFKAHNSIITKAVTSDVLKRTEKILGDALINTSDPKEFIRRLPEINLMNTRWTERLPESNDAVEFQIPSLYHHLIRLKRIAAIPDDSEKPQYERVRKNKIGGVLSYISKYRMSNGVVLSTDNPKHWDVIEEAIIGLSIQESEKLTDKINTVIAKRLGLRFSIDNVECSNCGHIVKTVNIDPVKLLFRGISAQSIVGAETEL